jgi:hypothetical protein
MLLNEYEIEFMFRKIRNIRNLGNFTLEGPHIVMSRTDAQNGLDFHFNFLIFEFSKKWKYHRIRTELVGNIAKIFRAIKWNKNLDSKSGWLHS